MAAIELFFDLFFDFSEKCGGELDFFVVDEDAAASRKNGVGIAFAEGIDVFGVCFKDDAGRNFTSFDDGELVEESIEATEVFWSDVLTGEEIFNNFFLGGDFGVVAKLEYFSH